MKAELIKKEALRAIKEENIVELKNDLNILESEFNKTRIKMQGLAKFACPGKEIYEDKIKEYYVNLKKYQALRDEINNRYDIIRDYNKRDLKNNEIDNKKERYITNTTHENQQKRLSKEIMNFIS